MLHCKQSLQLSSKTAAKNICDKFIHHESDKDMAGSWQNTNAYKSVLQLKKHFPLLGRTFQVNICYKYLSDDTQNNAINSLTPSGKGISTMWNEQKLKLFCVISKDHIWCHHCAKALHDTSTAYYHIIGIKHHAKLTLLHAAPCVIYST